MNFIENEIKEKSVKKKKRIFPTLLATLSGAVLGSILTVYSTNYVDLNELIHLPLVEGSTVKKEEQTTSSENIVPIEKTSSNSSSQMLDSIENVSEAVVGVVNVQQQTNNYYQNTQSESDSQDSGTGSGVIFKKNGDIAYIVTNNHVIEGADRVEVSLANGNRVEAKVVGTDPLSDIAVLKIDSKNATVVASFGESSALRVGEQVAAIGNPLGLDFSGSVTQGIISSKERTVAVSTSEGDWDLNVIQTDAAINPGNSGGALINSSGQVVGINSLKISEEGVEGLGFAIPTEDVKPIIEDLLEDGKVSRPYLGVGLQSINELDAYTRQSQLKLSDEVTEGVVVYSVDPSSSAASAGLQVKDVIVSIDGTKVSTVGDFRKYLYTQATIGKESKIDVYRNGEKISLTIKISEQNT